MTQKTVILIGTSGLTGSLLLEELIWDKSISKIKTFSRSPLQNTNPKVEQFTLDLLELEKYENDFHADIVFCCIGTTKAKTPDKKAYKAIDYGIPVAAAKLCKTNQIETIIVISALGADSGSSIFYNKTKGEMQDAVLNEGVKNTYILQPSLILGQRKEFRLGEKIGEVLMTLFSLFLFGKLKKYKAIHAKTIAEAMLHLAKHNYTHHIIPSDEIKNIVAKRT
jgi:uncharacterized protein YbjT (DUF2867 family)